MEIQPDFRELLALLNKHAAAAKSPGNYGDVHVFFIGRKEFIANKRAMGRKQDLADIEALGE